MPDSLDPGQARDEPDLGQNCLQRLSAENRSHPWRVKRFYKTTC